VFPVPVASSKSLYTGFSCIVLRLSHSSKRSSGNFRRFENNCHSRTTRPLLYVYRIYAVKKLGILSSVPVKNQTRCSDQKPSIYLFADGACNAVLYQLLRRLLTLFDKFPPRSRATLDVLLLKNNITVDTRFCFHREQEVSLFSLRTQHVNHPSPCNILLSTFGRYMQYKQFNKYVNQYIIP
jgi:hypothetical protein